MSTDTPDPTPQPVVQPADGLYVRTREHIAESMGDWGLGFDVEDEHDGPSLMRVVMAHVEPIILRLRATEQRLDEARQSASPVPQVREDGAYREQIARILHDAATGRIVPDPADPTPYGRMAGQVYDEVVSPLLAERDAHVHTLDHVLEELHGALDRPREDASLATFPDALEQVGNLRAAATKFDERLSDLQVEYAKHYASWERQRTVLEGAVANARAKNGDNIADREKMLRDIMAERDEVQRQLTAEHERAEGWHNSYQSMRAELESFVEASLEECDYTSNGESGGWEPDDYERAKANVREMHRLLLVRMERLFQSDDREKVLLAEIARLRLGDGADVRKKLGLLLWLHAEAQWFEGQMADEVHALTRWKEDMLHELASSPHDRPIAKACREAKRQRDEARDEVKQWRATFGGSALRDHVADTKDLRTRLAAALSEIQRWRSTVPSVDQDSGTPGARSVVAVMPADWQKWIYDVLTSGETVIFVISEATGTGYWVFEHQLRPLGSVVNVELPASSSGTGTEADDRPLWREGDRVTWTDDAGTYLGTVALDEQPGIFVTVRYDGTLLAGAVRGDKLSRIAEAHDPEEHTDG